MNRRHFLTISALAPLARPAGGIVMDMASLVWDRMALLTPFCLKGGNPELRKGLRSVFAIDGHMVASDGRVCVRARMPGARRKDKSAPTAENLNWAGPWNRGFRIAKFPVEPQYETCAVCGRIGPYDVSVTEGYCCWCESEGHENRRTGELPAEFGGLAFRLTYLQAVMQLPGVVWHLPYPTMPMELAVGWEVPRGPIRFTWGDEAGPYGDGLLMPVSKQHGCEPNVWLEAEWEDLKT